VTDTFVADIRLEELDHQQYRRLELSVSGAKGLGPADRDMSDDLQTLDDESTPLVLWADLVRPRPGVKGDEKPGTICGELIVELDIRDEPEFYQPGEPIEPEARFEFMSFYLDVLTAGAWTPLWSRNISAPNEVVTRSSGWQPNAQHRYWLMVRDRAGNLDEVSEQEFGARQTAEQFLVEDCRTSPEDSNNCTYRRCDGSICKWESWCGGSGQCLSCSCDGRGQCPCTNTCDDPTDDDADPVVDYPRGGADENYILTTDLPLSQDVENIDADSAIGVLASTLYPAMFGLLDEFGERARLVPRNFAPEEIADLELLIVPSGGLRNAKEETLVAGLRDYVEGGGNLLVFDQAFGRDWSVLPGSPSGYGWQEDRSCWGSNVWWEEEYAGHPVLSTVRGQRLTAWLDGHLTGYPEGSEVLLRKVSNNRAALVKYSYGAGTVTVTSAFPEFNRVLRHGRRAARRVVRPRGQWPLETFGNARGAGYIMSMFERAVSLLRCEDYQPQKVRETLERIFRQLGGLAQLVEGKRVLVKPNFLIARRVERAVTTHPVVIAEVARAVKEAGAKSVVVADSPAVGRARGVAARIGLLELLEPLGVEVEDFVEEVSVPRPAPFVSLKLARQAVEAEAVINIGKLKTHGLCGLTLAVKNCFGCVVGLAKSQWHVRAHSNLNFFARLLVEICRAVKPALNIVDAVMAMDGNGPNSGRARPGGFLAASRDPFMLDRMLARICQVAPSQVITFAHDGLGENPQTDFPGLRPEELVLSGWLMPRSRSRGVVRIPWLSDRLAPTPRFLREKCTLCGQCLKICPVGALRIEKDRIRLDARRCVHCLCCQETCPEGAIEARRGWLHR